MSKLHRDIETRTLPQDELVVTQTYSTDPKNPEMTVTLHSTGPELQLDAPHERIANIRYFEQLDETMEYLNGFRNHRDMGVSEVLTPDKHTLVLKSNSLKPDKDSPEKIYKHNYRLSGSDLDNFVDAVEKRQSGQQFSIRATSRDGDSENLDITLFSKNGYITVEIHTRLDVKRETEDEVLKSSFALMNERAHEDKRITAMSVVDRLLPKLQEHLPEVSFSEINLRNFNNEKIVLNVAAHGHMAEIFSEISGQLQTMEDKGVVAENKARPTSMVASVTQRRGQADKPTSIDEEVAVILHKYLGEQLPDERRKAMRQEIVGAVAAQRGQGK